MRARFDAAVRKLVGLFIDDGSFAAAIVGWVAVMALIVRSGSVGEAYAGLVLFGGLAALLGWTCVRAIRQAEARKVSSRLPGTKK